MKIIKKNCKICGREFEVEPQWLFKKYCNSRECHKKVNKKYQKKRREKIKDKKISYKLSTPSVRELEESEVFKQIMISFFKPIDERNAEREEKIRWLKGIKGYYEYKKNISKKQKEKAIEKNRRESKEFLDKHPPLTIKDVAERGLSHKQLLSYTKLSPPILDYFLHWMVYHGFLRHKKHIKESKYYPSNEYLFEICRINSKKVLDIYPATQISLPLLRDPGYHLSFKSYEGWHAEGRPTLPYPLSEELYPLSLNPLIYGFDHQMTFYDKNFFSKIESVLSDVDKLMMKLVDLKQKKMGEVWNTLVEEEVKKLNSDIGEYICYQFFDRIDLLGIEWDDSERKKNYIESIKKNIFSPDVLSMSYYKNRNAHYLKLPRFYYFSYLKMPKSIEEGWDMCLLHMMLGDERKVSNFVKSVKEVIEKKLKRMSRKEKARIISIVISSLEKIWFLYQGGITITAHYGRDWFRNYVDPKIAIKPMTR